jgi:hypothetical protein
MEVNVIKILIFIFVLIIGLGIAFLLAGALTGRDRRAYTVLQPNEYQVVNGQSIKANELAEKYQPRMNVRNGNETPALLWTWYEIAPDTDTFDIVYYQNWENEINPIPTLHKLYAVFRAAYYGYPLFDIEFFQVRVDKATGKVVGMLFETSPADNFYVTFSEHLLARYELQSDGSFRKTLRNKLGSVVSQSVNEVMFDGDHALTLAQTWNHLTRLLEPTDANIHYLDSRLKFLSADDYSKYKFVRKSQSDHKTGPNIFSLVFGTLCIYGLVTLPVVLLQSARKKKSEHPA